MVTRVYPAAIPAGHIVPLLATAMHTASLAARAGRCVMCVEQRAEAGNLDPVCRGKDCRPRFYALPLPQRNSLRRSSAVAA